MVVAIIIGVFSTLLLNLITLAVIGGLAFDTRDKFDSFLGFAELSIRNYADLEERVQGALDCLVQIDANLENAESRINAARVILEESRSRVG